MWHVTEEDDFEGFDGGGAPRFYGQRAQNSWKRQSGSTCVYFARPYDLNKYVHGSEGKTRANEEAGIARAGLVSRLAFARPTVVQGDASNALWKAI